MSVATVVHYLLPDPETVVAPRPPVDHGEMVRDVEKAFFAAGLDRADFAWEAVRPPDLDTADIEDGRTSDLVVVDRAVLARARRQRARRLSPAQVALVMEVTSRGNTTVDLPPPATLCSPLTGSCGHARAGIGHYLLVDRDPRVAKVLLYTDPDPEPGTYGTLAGMWDFGRTVELPEPFGLRIPTRLWEPWES